jgi:hypothetical protein
MEIVRVILDLQSTITFVKRPPGEQVRDVIIDCGQMNMSNFSNIC